MKITPWLLVLSLACLSACSTTAGGERDESAGADTQTVLVTYYVKPGKDAELQAVLAQAWELYRKEHLVLDQPHVIVRHNEPGDKTRLVEIFTWVSHSAPGRAPDSVKAIWNQEHSLCSAPEGHSGIEGGEVDLLVPTHH